jgi:hypothetical protein
MYIRIGRVTALAGLGLASLLLGSEASAQRQSGIQLTPDSRGYLINKFVPPNEQWAIYFNLEDRTAVGNVFKTDGGPPSFVWCEIVGETPSANPAENQYLMNCKGADACDQAPCSDANWVDIGTNLPINGSFLLPTGTKSTLSGNVQPIFNERCALSGCHAGALPAQMLSLEPGESHANLFLRLSTTGHQHGGETAFLVEPFDPSVSHIIHKLEGDEDAGEPMPMGGPPLSEEQIQAVSDWILEGAADN